MKIREIVLTNDLPFLPVQILAAGQITTIYETGHVRYIKCDNKDVVRMIYPALRDENWNTIPFTIFEEKVEKNNDGFSVNYRAAFNSGDIKYEAQFEITGSADTVVFEMKGKALSNFKSKRIGLCLLHPILPCAGLPVDIIKPGGKVDISAFPILISPSQPFTDITGMRWMTRHNIKASLIFEDDIFETEDQRNWTDDSYKTYSGPLYLVPMLHLKEGDTMHHKIILKAVVQNALSEMAAPADLGKRRNTPFPQIGYKREEDQKELTGNDIKLLSKIPFHHYLVEIKLSDANWAKKLKLASEEASKLHTKLRLNILFKLFSASEINDLVKELGAINNLVESLLILSEAHPTPPHDVYSITYNAIKNNLPDIQVGYGSNSWFAHVNSNFPVALKYDFISFTISPQAHQTDNRTIIENLRSQHMLIKTLQQRSGAVPVHVSVIFSKGIDARLHTNFAAWWTINTISNFSEATHLTLYNLKGESGLIYDSDKQPSPLYRVLENIHECKPVKIIDESVTGIEDPVEAIKAGRICIEDERGDRICFTMKDI